MLGAVFDVFRLRQYFNVITRTREWVEGLRADAGLLTDVVNRKSSSTAASSR